MDNELKFIELSTKQGDKLLINVRQIVYIKKQNYGAKILLTDSKEIETDNNYDEIKKEMIK